VSVSGIKKKNEDLREEKKVKYIETRTEDHLENWRKHMA
jgi:hypothetical protein